MRILHYFLGFPPYRTGGLTKFAYDLMSSQSMRNDKVFALWPGQIMPAHSSVKIVRQKNVGKIRNYEILNPLPVPLDEGISDIKRFTASCDKNIYLDFFKSLKPDVIHIHTLMGMHKEFIEAANQLKIKTVFTTHDYFGICPKVTLFRNGDVCDCDHECADCVNCNKTALSYKKIMILQSHLYIKLKDSFLVKKLRQKHRSDFFEDTSEKNEITSKASRNDVLKYRRLRKFYTYILENIDVIHFNSSVAETVYRRYITPKKSILLSISNKEITDNTNLEKSKSDKVRFTFLSPAKQFKGYNIIKETFDRLWQEGKRDFVLNLYTPVPKAEPYMNIQERGFRRDELSEIFSNTDYLLAPSVWYETFGFTVLEALSYATPVIISDRVGAKDIIGDYGIIIKASDADSLYKAVQKSSSLDYSDNVKICNWNDYVSLNYNIYK